MSMFTNYDNQESGYIPDNRVEFLVVDSEYQDTIVVGGTCSHMFEVSFDVSTLVKSLTVYYKENLKIILTKSLADVTITKVSENDNYINITLTPEESLLFGGIQRREAFIQIEFNLKDGTILFSNIFKLKILNTLAHPEV